MHDIETTVKKLMVKLADHPLDEYEVFATRTKGVTIEVKDGDLDVFVASENVGVSVRALKDQRPGFAFGTNLSSSAMISLVDRVLEGVGVTDPDPYLGFPLPQETSTGALAPYDRDLSRISIKEKIDKARELEKAALAYDGRVKKVRKADYVETAGEVLIANHCGLQVGYEKTLVSGSIVVVAEDGQDAEMGWDYGFAPFFHDLDMETIGNHAAARAVEGLGARPVGSGTVPAILPPWVAADLLQVLSESFTADNVQKGKSMLVDHVGNALFSNKINIIDNGLYEGGMATSPFDDEGSPRQYNQIVSEGILQGFLYDQYTANKEGCSSTGNAGRQGIHGPPTAQPTNFYIKNGNTDPLSIRSSTGRGLFVTDLMGIHTADPITGDFSVGGAGLWVENGEIVFPVKGMAVAGNLLQLFRKVADVGNDLTFYGPFGSPTLVIPDLNISGSAS